MNDYFLNLNKEIETDFIVELEQYAQYNNVPITKDKFTLSGYSINVRTLVRIPIKDTPYLKMKENMHNMPVVLKIVLSITKTPFSILLYS